VKYGKKFNGFLPDPLTRAARDIERSVPFFRNRVNKARRQLGANDTDVVTITSLRGACITLAEGIGGIKYGARPVPLSDDRTKAVLEVGVEWFRAVTEAIGPAMEDRLNKLASAPTVLPAIGAMGQEFVNIDDPVNRSTKMARLKRSRRWRGSRNPHSGARRSKPPRRP
jgi:hypothetical protein